MDIVEDIICCDYRTQLNQANGKLEDSFLLANMYSVWRCYTDFWGDLLLAVLSSYGLCMPQYWPARKYPLMEAVVADCPLVSNQFRIEFEACSMGEST